MFYCTMCGSDDCIDIGGSYICLECGYDNDYPFEFDEDYNDED